MEDGKHHYCRDNNFHKMSLKINHTIPKSKRYYYYYFFKERGREGERERNTDVREKHQLVASCMLPTGDLACNPGVCPDWEWNW